MAYLLHQTRQHYTTLVILLFGILLSILLCILTSSNQKTLPLVYFAKPDNIKCTSANFFELDSTSLGILLQTEQHYLVYLFKPDTGCILQTGHHYLVHHFKPENTTWYIFSNWTALSCTYTCTLFWSVHHKSTN